MKITPVLYMDAIEPSLEFWVDRLGFEKTVEVPAGAGLGFVILQHGAAELMLQTRASVAEDLPSLASGAAHHHGLSAGLGIFIEVPDFDDLLRRLKGVDPLIPVRTTFYGMKEMIVREPGGNIICFAAASNAPPAN